MGMTAHGTSIAVTLWKAAQLTMPSTALASPVATASAPAPAASAVEAEVEPLRSVTVCQLLPRRFAA
jgi:hypothetical protein